MVDVQESLATLKVIKRNGKKVDFDGVKIAMAIKKGFDSIVVSEDEDGVTTKYLEKDINSVYNAVINKIEKEYLLKEKIKIEEIQDLIEETLQKKGYDDVYKSFSEYRERRNQSRQLFFDQKKQHKFLKSLELLGLKSAREENSKRENANVDGDTAIWINNF